MTALYYAIYIYNGAITTKIILVNSVNNVAIIANLNYNHLATAIEYHYVNIYY